MKTILIVIFCFAEVAAFAQTQIKIEDAKINEGDSVKICNKIFSGKYLASAKDPVTLLDFGGNYPDQLLTLVIHNDTRNLFNKPPEEYYKGAQVCVTGVIKIFKGKPEILINNPNQIQEVIIDKIKAREPE
jgi:DNA/RNA endonuclease YhcR with UshA esterase domain